MDYHHGTDCCSPSHSRRQRLSLTPKWSLFMAFVAVGIAVAAVHIKPANGQDQNAPPILYVRERNWRISESEQINQIIDRVRAEDPDGDDLEFGLEPRFMPHAGAPPEKLPFRIDSQTGVVYLNESLEGRAGENFLIYITVTDGQYTAKNEVFINILGQNDNKFSFGAHQPPSISNVVQNISQFLPAFDKLPGVQSIRNQMPNRRPTNGLPPGFPGSLGSFSGGGGGGNVGFPPLVNFYPNGNLNQQVAFVPATSNVDASGEPTTDTATKMPTTSTTSSTGTATATGTGTGTPTGTAPAVTTTAKSRTKLTPISVQNEQRPQHTSTYDSSHNEKNATRNDEHAGNPTLNSVAAFTFKSTIIPVVIAICALFATAAVIVGFLYRKRLCAISKTLKKKSKEEMAKKSNQSNLSSTLTDDSRNSMVLQQWNGPVAFGNRYVPWERDQQLTMMATSQLSTSAANGEIAHHAGAVLGNGVMPGVVAGVTGIGLAGGGGGAGAGGMMGNGVAGAHGNQSKYDRWEFPRHRLKFFNILGEGAFGQVWRCEATDIDGNEGITTVAVKTLKESAAEIEKKDLLSELEVMKSLEPHVNVVRLLGSCTDKDPTFVIIEYVNRGKLQTYLRNSRAERHYGNTHGKSNILTSGDLTSFMYQVAKGMDYLTSRGIIHRDLAARNVLITDDHTCKVADFGFARDVITSKIYERKSEGKLPIRWMAIESLYDNIFSVKSDVWSFGILMWEIVTLGSTPYPGISAADVMRKVRDGYRLEKPEHCRRELYNIMYYCWSQDPNERPHFGEIVHMLDKLLHTEMDYIELERFPDHNYYNIVNLSDEKL